VSLCRPIHRAEDDVKTHVCSQQNALSLGANSVGDSVCTSACYWDPVVTLLNHGKLYLVCSFEGEYGESVSSAKQSNKSTFLVIISPKRTTDEF
jgi:hypothetical protein